MLVNTYNQKGEKLKQTRLPSEIFDVKLNSDLVHQIATSQMANRRKVIAHTKDRSEVRGGGKKPWRQKGTGRARHGSIRSPIWIGGGVTFGPTKNRNFKKRILKKMRRKALFMVLSSKVKENFLILLDELKLEPPKTKTMLKVLENLKIKDSGLIVLPEVDRNIILAARNIPRFDTCQAKDLNVLDLLSSKYLLVSKKDLEVIKDTFISKSTYLRKGRQTLSE